MGKDVWRQINNRCWLINNNNNNNTFAVLGKATSLEQQARQQYVKTKQSKQNVAVNNANTFATENTSSTCSNSNPQPINLFSNWGYFTCTQFTKSLMEFLQFLRGTASKTNSQEKKIDGS